MISLLSKSKTKEDTNIDLNEIYVDIDGNKWYEFKDMLTLPTRRAIAGEVATKWASMNITPDLLKQTIQVMKQYGNEGKIVDMFHLLGELEFRLDYISEEKTLLDLACVYFVIDGEDIIAYNPNEQDRKKEILERDAKAKGFFLQKAWQHTTNYGNMSETDITDYLVRNKDQADILQNLLHKMKS